ncbi:hypothetical protein ACO0QE_003254 [Hanseniaspora vineae]
MVQFGHQFKQTHFRQLEKDVVLINHGSYGTTPSMVLDEQIKVVKEHEDYPDRFEYFTGGDKYIKQVQALATYMGLSDLWKSIVLVSNATTGVNTVLRSYPWNFSKDKLLLHSTTYGACSNTVQFLHDYYGLQYEVVSLQYPMEDCDVVAKFEEKLQKGGFTMCMFDMISSIPGVTLPFEQLTELCNKYRVLSLIDGAHGAGLVDFGFVATCKPTFVVSNLHKWLNVPKSCAMLYVDPKFHHVVQSILISWNYHLKPSKPDMLLVEKFARTGTISYSSYLCVKKAIEFRSIVCGGEENIRNYQISLRQQAVPKISAIWTHDSRDKANILENSTNTLSCPGMFSVRFPLDKHKYKLVYEKLLTDASYYPVLYKKYVDLVIKKYKTYAPFGVHNKEVYVRFSAQVFNEVQDYVVGAKLIETVLYKIFDQETQKLAAERKQSKL